MSATLRKALETVIGARLKQDAFALAAINFLPWDSDEKIRLPHGFVQAKSPGEEEVFKQGIYRVNVEVSFAQKPGIAPTPDDYCAAADKAIARWSRMDPAQLTGHFLPVYVFGVIPMQMEADIDGNARIDKAGAQFVCALPDDA